MRSRLTYQRAIWRATRRARPIIYKYLSYVRRPGPACGPRMASFCAFCHYGQPQEANRKRPTACYSELIYSVCLFAMDSTRREAALARRRERERARRANETAEEREARLTRRRVRDRRANETSPSPNCSKYNSNVQKLCSPTMYKNCVPIVFFSAHAAHARPKDVCIALDLVNPRRACAARVTVVCVCVCVCLLLYSSRMFVRLTNDIYDLLNSLYPNR